MRMTLCCCLVLVVAAGCSHRHYLDLSDVKALRSVNERASMAVCAVRTADGRVLEASGLALSSDSTSWIDTDTGEAVLIPTREVDHIFFVDRGAGAIEGAGVGFALGALCGGFLGYVSGSDETTGTEIGSYTRAEGALLGVIIFGVPAAVIGLLVGTAGGSRDIYYPVSSDSLSGAASALHHSAWLRMREVEPDAGAGEK